MSTGGRGAAEAGAEGRPRRPGQTAPTQPGRLLARHETPRPGGLTRAVRAIDISMGDVMARLHTPTPGTRIAVWIFPALTLGLGLGYLFADRSRLTSPAFGAAKHVMPLWIWGIVFVAIAVGEVACILRGNAHWFIVAMCAGMSLYTCWSFLFAVAYLTDPHTSPGAPAWPLFVVASHAATLATLTGRGRA